MKSVGRLAFFGSIQTRTLGQLQTAGMIFGALAAVKAAGVSKT